MKVYTPPARPSGHETTNDVFLAGSIEMGAAAEWQQEVIIALEDIPGAIYNPRRPDWNLNWGEESQELKDQINWELDAIEVANTVFFYFQANTKSPISLLELGKMVAENAMIKAYNDGFCTQELIVVCESGFWRRTNVQVLCQRENVRVYDDLASGIQALRERTLDF